MAQKMKEESQRRLSTYTQTGEPGEGDFGYGFPSSSSGGRTRDPSAARSERSQAHGLRSPMVVSGASQLYPTSPLPHAHHPAYPHVPRPSIGDRGASFVSSASGTSRGGSDTEGPGHTGSVVEQDNEHPGDEEPRMEDWRDGGADGPHSPTDSDDENGEVEYTLKDRQDVSLSVRGTAAAGEPEPNNTFCRQSTSNIRSGCRSGNRPCTKSPARSPAERKKRFTPLLLPSLYTIFSLPTLFGRSCSAPHCSSFAV